METIYRKEEDILNCRSYKLRLIWNITCHAGFIRLYNSKGDLLVANECTKKKTLDSYRQILKECKEDKSYSLIARIRDLC